MSVFGSFMAGQAAKQDSEILELRAERDKLKAQRDALLAAAKWCVRLLDDLAKREQENSTALYKDKFSMFEYTASKNAKAVIEEAEK